MEVKGQLHALAALPPRKNSNVHLIGGWVGLTAGLEDLENRNISCPWRDSNPGPSSPWFQLTCAQQSLHNCKTS